MPDPRAGLLLDVEGRVGFPESIERFPDLDAGGLNLVVKRKHSLDQPSRTCCGLGVADLRFDGTERTTVR